MSDKKLESLKDLMGVVGSADVGLVILDRQYTIRVWNLFMVNHSGKSAESVIGTVLFKQFPDIVENWFCEKAQQAIAKKSKVLSTWQERPYLFEFTNVRRAKSEAYMSQNITYIPLASASGEIDNFAIIINDVTDIAASTQQLDVVVSEYSQGQLDKN